MTASREIVFIDQNVFDLHSLLAGLRPDVEPIVLTASARATAQIATALKGRDDLHAIHIIAHGSAGEVRFGAGVLSRETLHDHAADLAEIGRALGRDGQLSLWSCETGQGKRGAAFVDALERATGADVAATVGLVGSAERGGRWELDSGFAQAPVTLEGMAAYAGVMQTHLDAFSLTAITDDVGPDDFLTNDHSLILHGTLDYRGADGTNQTTSFKIYLSGGEFGATPTYVGTFSFPEGSLLGDPSTTTTVDWSFNLQTLGVSAAQYLNDGTYTLLLVDASPSGGNLIVNEGGNNHFTIDSSIDLDPPTQTVVIDTITDDVAPSIGTVADGGTTNDTAPALAGTLSAILGVGEVLSIFRDGVKIGVADVAGTNWTFSDAGPLVDGTSYTYTARVVDAANNLGPASNAYDITIDTSNPTAAVDITAIADDTGTAGDFTTSDTTLTVSGTNGALGAGEKVQVSTDGLNWVDVSQDTGTTWHYVDPTNHGADFTYQARVIDAAANVGNSDSQAVTIDTSNPTAAVDITAIADDTGTAGDFTTSDTTLTVSGTNGALGAGEKVQVSTDGLNWVDVSQDTGTTWHYVDPTNHGADFTYQARVIDAAANVGNSDSQAVTIDTSNPTAAVDITAIADDTGTAGDFTTSDTTLTVSGTNGALGAGEKVQVSTDGLNWVDVSQDTGTTWHYVDPATHGADFTYQARVIDAAANVGNSDSQAVTIDTSNPTAAVDITAIADDTGTAGDFTTSDTTLTVSGTNGALGAGEKVQVSTDGLNWVDVSQDTGTTWHYVDPATHGADFTYQARVIDAAANVGNSDSQAVTIDTSNPTAAVDITAIADDTGTAGDFTTSDTTLTVSGTNGALGAGEKVQVSTDGLNWVDVSQDTGTTWHYVDPANHGADFTYQARVIDAAANVGNSDSQAVTINDPAAAYDDAVATTENTIVTADVFEDNGFGADSNPDGFSVTAMSGGTVGTQITLLSGALLTLNADGTLSYDPNHRFDYLPTLGSGASNLTVTDTFTYTTTGGNTATVTVTVSGVDTDDVLYDSAGIDTLAGGIGNDVYYVNNTDDVVIEAANAGIDIVGATVNYTLSENHNIEVLSMLGSGLTGTGSSGTDTLHSAGGPNTLIGLGGDDHYYVNNSADVVIEEANGGIDIVGATVNYTLSENHNIEALSMLGSGLTGTGSSGADTLHSGWGANTLVGLGGDDLYFVNNSADVVIEAANGGNDFVGATVDYTLSENHNIETLSMLGSGLTGTGSAGSDTLYSYGGPNTLVGLGGDDVYYVNNREDVVIEAANAGNERVLATVSYTLPANVEVLYVNGSGLTGTGSSSADTLVTLGANTLIGGNGNDTFVFCAGSANGATVADFDHNQADLLVFSGFGTEGATFSQIGNTDQWQIHSGLDGHNETITLGVGPLHAGDFVFI